MTKTVVSKKDIIRDVADSLGFAQKSTGDVIDAFLGAITSHAVAGDTVNIAGFGRFAVKTRAARTARNPRTGEDIAVAESRILAFKPTKSKKE